MDKLRKKATQNELCLLEAKAHDAGCSIEFIYALGNAALNYDGPPEKLYDNLYSKAARWLSGSVA